jgi:ATP-dependent DNA helicase PIF1
MNLSIQAKKAIQLISKKGENVFVTGRAGTGKSTLLEYIRMKAEKRVVVLAPTGISAINVNGETIHSFFTLKPGFEKDEAKKMKIDERKRKKFKALKAIAIDEISMVRADILDAIDIVLRRSRKSSTPFGGVQMIFFGDLYQLPPVVTLEDKEKFFSEYKSPYFFDADVFHNQGKLFSSDFNLEVIELDEVYRQKDKEFIELLNSIRDNSIDCVQMEKINERCNPDFSPKDEEKYIYLTTTNMSANKINERKLGLIEKKEKTFIAEKTGTFAKNLYPNDEEVRIKEGSQIMFICNDKERRWVNGTIGKVLEIFNEKDENSGVLETFVRIEKSNGKVVEVKRHTWEISKYVYIDGKFERKNLGTFNQIPIKLAWAITIHKSQGKTFDKIIIDLERGGFAHGQTYVAISRCSSLEGVVLKRKLKKSDIIMDERILSFTFSKKIN